MAQRIQASRTTSPFRWLLNSFAVVALVPALCVVVIAQQAPRAPSDLRILAAASGGCSLANGHSHATMAAANCFPNASNTGVPSGTTLTAYTGGTTISTPTTIDSKIISSCLTFTSGAVGSVIRKSRLICNGNAVTVDDRGTYSATSGGTVPILTIEDSELSCNFVGGSAWAVAEAHVRVTRAEITGCGNGLALNQNALIQDSFIHNLQSDGAEAHEDGGQFGCAHWVGSGSACGFAGYAPGTLNITYTHNTIYGMSANDTVFGTSALIFASHASRPGDTNLVVSYNLVAGGAYTIYCNQASFAGANRNTLTGNHFSTIFKASVGAFGPSDNCSDENISGNIYHESGLPIKVAQNDLGRPVYNLLNAVQLFSMPWSRVRVR